MGLFNKKELARIAELERENAILKSTLDKTQGLSIAQEEKYLQKLKEQNQKERSQIRAFQKDVEALVAQKQALEQSLADLNLEVDDQEYSGDELMDIHVFGKAVACMTGLN